LASSGGKVVKNVAGYDLPKLMTGALGTLGVITRAVFRLHPLPHNERSFTFAARDSADANRLVLAVHDSKLAHTGLQVRLASGSQPEVDIRFDGTEAGLAAQSETLRKLAEPATEKGEAGDSVWQARQTLFGGAPEMQGSHPVQLTAIAKFSVLPGSIGGACDSLRDLSAPLNLRWQAVVQGTGLGWVRSEAENGSSIHQLLATLRTQLESANGSLVVVYRSPEIPGIDAWGKIGDAFPLMQSVKQQFDPHNTLNPGRFVGGI
jgi:glycolate oxidase FAD binding subunit